jgi:lipopolysaccharide/colanic/teichoic acid biosynthesis glycosyltransferase
MLVALDAVALLLAVAVSALVRDTYPVVAGLLIVPVWMLVVALHGGYDPRHAAGGVEAKRLTDASVRVAIGVALLSYALSLDAGRHLVVTTLPAGLTLLVVGRLVGRGVLVRMRRTGRFTQRVLAVGTVLDVLHLTEQARRSPAAGFVVAGACVPAYAGPDRRRPADRRASRGLDVTRQRSGDRRAEDDRRAGIDELASLGVPVVGEPNDVLHAAHQVGAHAVAIAGHGVLSRHALRRLAWQLEGTRVRLFVASALTEVATPRISLQPLGGLPLLEVEAPVFSGGRRVLKGVLDRVLASALVVALSPALLALAVLIRLDSPGPVLFRQQRVGRDGVPFTCLKLRTMRVGADREVSALATHNESDGVLFKMRSDPRVTRVGRVLRRLSLDELPQLFNVLGGSMSLVGPRPRFPARSSSTATTCAGGCS